MVSFSVIHCLASEIRLNKFCFISPVTLPLTILNRLRECNDEDASKDDAPISFYEIYVK